MKSLIRTAVRAVLIEQRFARFSSFFFEENEEKQEKQAKIPKFGHLTEGNIFGTLRIQTFEKQ